MAIKRFKWLNTNIKCVALHIYYFHTTNIQQSKASAKLF